MLHALPVSAAADGVFTLSDRTEVRVRDPDPVTNAVALDFDTQLDARATLASRAMLYTLAYQPRLTLLDINGAGIQPALLNTMLGAAEWHSHRVHISLTEKASYGGLSFESLSALSTPGAPVTAPGPGGAPAPLPTVQQQSPTQSILFASSETTLASTVQLHRWTGEGKVGYQLSGGADDSARQTLPFQQGPFAEATVDYRATGHDHFATVGNASETSFSIGTDDLLGSIEEQWRHRWAQRTETMLSVGAAEARTRTAFNAPYGSQADVVAEAAVDQQFQRGIDHGEVRLDVRLAPLVNRLTGLVDQRIVGTAEALWSRRRVTFRLFGTAGESVDEDTTIASRLVAAEVDASYHVNEALTFDTGARTLYQVQNEPGVQANADAPVPIVPTVFKQSVIFFAVTVRAVKAKF